jgi:rRNA-processing protein FCF1
MKTKVMDANLLLRFIKECDFIELFTDWGKSGKYILMITPEVNREIIRNPTREKLDTLINDHIIHLLPETDTKEILIINNLYRMFSQQDCSIFYQCLQNPQVICLTDDNPLRNALKKIKIEVHGTLGIHDKIIRDKKYPESIIEEKMKIILNDPRVNPEVAKMKRKTILKKK